MDRPPSNAIHPGWIQGFGEILDRLEADESVRCVIVTSALERIFMAGADIAFLQEMHRTITSREKGDLPEGELDNPLQGLFNRLEALPKPVIACINGHALGGGCELALACDYRLMAEDEGKIGLTEVNLGIIPAAGGTQRMVRLLGKARALPLMLEGRRLTPPEALEAGLVHALHPKERLFDACVELAARLAVQPPIAVAEILRCAHEGGDLPLAEGLAIEMRGFVRCLQTQDAMEGFQAFFEKRPPRFRGR